MNAEQINAAATDARYPQTLVDAVRYFADPDTAIAFMVSIRWPKGVCCPTCGGTRIRYIRTRQQWECRETHPKRRFSVKTGTIMEDSPLSLDKWLIALWLEVNAKNSISSYEVHRSLGVTQKTAWFMQQRIRMAMHVGSFDTKFQGHVEADETYIGGAARNMHKDKRKARVHGTGPCGSGKTAVMGLLERHGTVRTFVVGDTGKRTLQPIIRTHVASGSTISTDAWAVYTGLSAEYIHGVVDHAERYVDGLVVQAVREGDARQRRAVPPVPVLGCRVLPVQQPQG